MFCREYFELFDNLQCTSGRANHICFTRMPLLTYFFLVDPSVTKTRCLHNNRTCCAAHIYIQRSSNKRPIHSLKCAFRMNCSVSLISLDNKITFKIWTAFSLSYAHPGTCRAVQRSKGHQLLTHDVQQQTNSGWSSLTNRKAVEQLNWRLNKQHIYIDAAVKLGIELVNFDFQPFILITISIC